MTAKRHLAAEFAEELDSGVDDHGVHQAAHSADPLLRAQRGKRERLKDAPTDDRAIRSRVDEKRRLHPGGIGGQNAAANYRTLNAIVAKAPFAVNLHIPE